MQNTQKADLHTDFSPCLLTRETIPTKKPHTFLYLKQETPTPSSDKAHQVPHSLKLRSCCLTSCGIPGMPALDLFRPPSHREWHCSQSGKAAYLLKKGAGDAPTIESLQKSNEDLKEIRQWGTDAKSQSLS